MNTRATFSAGSISVIICAYTLERWDRLTCAVSSIRQQTYPAQEIIVVIDHNQELLQKAQHELGDVRVIENTEKQGLSGARNSGIAAACGTFIAFLDDDAIAQPDWLWHMHMALCGHQACPDGHTNLHSKGPIASVGTGSAQGTTIGLAPMATAPVRKAVGTVPCACPMACLPNGQACPDDYVLGVGTAVLPDWEGQEPSWFPAEFYWVVGCSYRGMPRMSAPIRNPIGASMCIRREVFQAVGGFRSEIGRVGTLPIGCEETELCIRARQYSPDRYFLYLPQVHVAHLVSKKRATWRYFCSRCYAEGISKAVVARFVGAKDSLSSESLYTLQTLPIGILRNFGLALLKRRFSYILRALAIVVGLCITATGYLVGKYTSLSLVKHGDVQFKDIDSLDKQKVPL